MSIPIVIIESPYAGHVAQNLEYVRACMANSLARGEAPFASHALYNQPGVLDDTIPAERDHGIQAGFAFREVADLTVFYVDRGVSSGMLWGAKHCREIACSAVIRAIGDSVDLRHAAEELGYPDQTIRVSSIWRSACGVWNMPVGH